MSDLYPDLLRDAFVVLDRYVCEITNRDPTKSLNEDGCELLRRVRAGMQPLIFNGAIRRDDVAEIAQRIDDFLLKECSVERSAVPRRGLFYGR